MERIHVDLLVTGSVQGVWHPRTADHHATRLDLAACTVNQDDGSVRIAAETTSKDLMAFVNWGRMRPTRPHLLDLEVGQCLGFTTFIAGR